MKNSDHDWIKKLFKEIEFLLTSYNSLKERDRKITISWMEKVHRHFNEPEFNHITMARFLDNLSHIMDRHPKIKKHILKYVKDCHHKRLIKDILDKSYESLLLANPKELCNILRGISYLEIKNITEDWWSRWFSSSLEKMGKFKRIDTRQSIRSCARLHKTPPQEWCDAWEIKCEEHFKTFPIELDAFSKTLSAIGLLQININPSFLNELIKNTRVYLSTLTNKDLFLVSKSFSFEAVCKEKRLVSEWFDVSYKHIQSAQKEDLEALCVAFSFIGKLDENISLDWIKCCIEKITVDFDSLSIKAISSALYAMALFQIEPMTVRSFLERCKLLFRKERSKIFYELMTNSDFKHTFLASFYFKLKGYDLGLSLQDYPHLLEEVKNKKINPPSDGEKLVLEALEGISIHHVVHEYWINEIMDYSDFSVWIGDSQKLIEFDGHHHEVNGMTNRLTQLKTFILLGYGYELIRIDYKEKKQIKNILIQGLSIFSREQEKYEKEYTPNIDSKAQIYETFNLVALNPHNKEKATEEDCAKWINEIYTLFNTCESSQFRKLLLQFSLLVETNGKVRHVYQKYGSKNSNLKSILLNQCFTATKDFAPHELIELLHIFVRLCIQPTNSWGNTWCKISLQHINQYTVHDFESIFHYFHSLRIEFSGLWIQAFFNHTQKSLNNLNISELFELAHCCAYHQRDIPDDWAKELTQKLMDALNYTKDKIVFSFPKLFSMKALHENPDLLSKWFEQSSSLIKTTDPVLLIEALYQLAKTNISMPKAWLVNIQERICETFYILGRENITLLLFGLSSLESKIEEVRPILDACQNYFLKRESSVILAKRNINEISRLLLAVNYFNTFGYKIKIILNDENHLYETLFSEKTSAKSVKDKLEEHLKSTYFPDLTQSVRINYILQYVDYFSPQHGLIIEIDRKSKNRARSQIIKRMLDEAGYSIVRLDYSEIKKFGHEYVDKIIQFYFENKKISYVKIDIFAKPQFVSYEKKQEPAEQLTLVSDNPLIRTATENLNMTKKSLKLPIRSCKKKIKRKSKNQTQRKLNKNVLNRVLNI